MQRLVHRKEAQATCTTTDTHDTIDDVSPMNREISQKALRNVHQDRKFRCLYVDDARLGVVASTAIADCRSNRRYMQRERLRKVAS